MATTSEPISPQQSHHSARDRPRVISQLSYVSNRSRRSSYSHRDKENKTDLIETSEEKKRLKGKADPTKALSEAQPADVAQEESALADLSDMRYKDMEGNFIADPDRSNPTRHRLERPLDTIRAFNAAAEGTTSRRTSYQRPPQSQYGFNGDNRRGSYYGNANSIYQANGRAPRMTTAGGYYRQSVYGNGSRPEPLQEEATQYNSQYAPPRHTRYSGAAAHMHSESPVSNYSHQYSYDTGTSGSDENSKSTNPSSQNSSFDRIHQTQTGLRKLEEYPPPSQYDQYGRPPPQQQRQIPNNTHSHTNQYHSQHNGHYPLEQQRPAVVAPAKTIIKLSSQSPDRKHAEPEYWDPDQGKRKSWIKRTFSRR